MMCRTCSSRTFAAPHGYGPVANATVVTILEAAHTPIWEAPERTAELIGGAGVG